MSRKWERTFFVAVPVARAWRAFTDSQELAALSVPPPEHTGRKGMEGIRVLELERERVLRWAQERADLPERAEFAVVFESVERGTRITVTRHGFGEGEDADIFADSNALGWQQGIMDVIAYLQTGQLLHRHYEGSSRSASGVAYVETDAGVEVRRVRPGSFGEQAGLERGDLLVRVGGAAVFARSDMWILNGVHPPGTELEVEFVRDGQIRRGVGRLAPYWDVHAVGE